MDLMVKRFYGFIMNSLKVIWVLIEVEYMFDRYQWGDIID